MNTYLPLIRPPPALPLHTVGGGAEQVLLPAAGQPLPPVSACCLSMGPGASC